MKGESVRRWLPGFLQRYLWFFEAEIEDAVARLAGSLAPGARLLDAGAGEGQYKRFFPHVRYAGLDLAVGDAGWDYSRLDVVGDLALLPFRDGTFDAALNIVTLEHVPNPAAVLRELARVLRPGAELLLAAPQDWEVHQSPHDYFRYTRHGLRHLMESAGFQVVELRAAGGYFRLMGRRMLNGAQFFRGVWLIPALLALAPAGLFFPLLDALDRNRDFTLGYICTARRAANGVQSKVYGA